MKTELDPIPATMAEPCADCGSQPMLTGEEGEKSFSCHCSHCDRQMMESHWDDGNAIVAWNEAQRDCKRDAKIAALRTMLQRMVDETSDRVSVPCLLTLEQARAALEL